jgi:hypothetical protein
VLPPTYFLTLLMGLATSRLKEPICIVSLCFQCRRFNRMWLLFSSSALFNLFLKSLLFDHHFSYLESISSLGLGVLTTMLDKGYKRANKWCWTGFTIQVPFTQVGHDSQVHAHEVWFIHLGMCHFIRTHHHLDLT